MRKILIFDQDTPIREALVAQLRHMASAEIVLASDAGDVVERLQSDYWAALLVDTSLLDGELPRVLAAARTAAWRPLVLLVANDTRSDLDPDLISLVVRRPYEVPMVAGVLLAAITENPHGAAGDAEVAKPR